MLLMLRVLLLQCLSRKMVRRKLDAERQAVDQPLACRQQRTLFDPARAAPFSLLNPLDAVADTAHRSNGITEAKRAISWEQLIAPTNR